MKRVLYIGIYSDGSTSKLRADIIHKLLSEAAFEVIDTTIPFYSCNRISKSIGFRYKIGPVIKKVNSYILDRINGHYDLIWVDKAIYLRYETTKVLRDSCDKLIHYTPDPAFFYHKSKHFFDSIKLYDCVITTKKYELKQYNENINPQTQLIYLTQGFDKNLHRPLFDWKDKSGLIFIGRYEPLRGQIIKQLLENDILVKLAGPGWNKFAKKNQYKNLLYMGEGLYGEKYVEAISSSIIAIGFLSKIIPDQHTTRTFEIPACKTLLLTEPTDEIKSIFSANDVIFYDGIDQMISSVSTILHDSQKSIDMAERAYKIVMSGNYDYENQIKYILTTNSLL